MSQTLRKYQFETNEHLLPAAAAKHKKICVVGPCGCGKTTMIADLALRCLSKGSTMTVTAHRRRLIKQLSERLKGFGVRYSVEMASLPDEPWAVNDPGADVFIGSKDTMIARMLDGVKPRPTRVLVVDECHMYDNKAYQALGKEIAPEWTIGYTATPCRQDGSGFSPNLFSTLVFATTIEDLIAQQYLVEMECYSPIGAGKRRREGLKAGIMGDPVRQWIDHAAGLRTITFARTLKECRAVRDMFMAEMVPCDHVDANTPDEERDAAIDRLTSGETKVLVCTAGLMGVGVDIPAVECVQTLVRNISPRAFWQSCGRAQRTSHSTGKTRAVLLDHASAVFEHGIPNHSPVWQLGVNDSVQMRQMDRMDRDPAVRPSVCPACGTISTGGRCPTCNAVLVATPRKQTPTDRGNLEGVNSYNPYDARQEHWRKVLFTCAAKGYKCIVAAKMFKQKYGVDPDKAGVTPRFGFYLSNKLVAVQWPEFAPNPKVELEGSDA